MKATRLYIYYRVPSSDLDLARQGANMLFNKLDAIGVANTELLVRLEDGKPYSTLMEVIDLPASQPIEAFKKTVQDLAALVFQDWPQPPERVVEVFALAYDSNGFQTEQAKIAFKLPTPADDSV